MCTFLLKVSINCWKSELSNKSVLSLPYAVPSVLKISYQVKMGHWSDPEGICPSGGLRWGSLKALGLNACRGSFSGGHCSCGRAFCFVFVLQQEAWSHACLRLRGRQAGEMRCDSIAENLVVSPP